VENVSVEKLSVSANLQPCRGGRVL